MKDHTKRLFLLIAISTSLLNCNNEKKENVIDKAGHNNTFEQKQKLALGNDKQENDKGKIERYSLRYPAAKATAGVVHIRSLFTVNVEPEIPDFFRDFFDDDFIRRNFRRNGGSVKQLGSASGVIISNDGYIVTNNHVVNKAEAIEVILYDQRRYKAKVVGTDPATDLALLKIPEGKLSFIEFGNSDSVEVGDMVLAVGNPFNLASTVTAGIVSAKARNIHVITDKWAVESYIQTDAAMNPGNSGGALVDINGRLVGITAAIASPTGAYAGYSFAIPVNIVKKTVDDLLRYGKVLHGYFGVVIRDMDANIAKKLGTGIATGVLIEDVAPNGAAMNAGIKKYDVITKMNGQTIDNPPKLQELIARSRPGEKLLVTIIRDGRERTMTVTLMPVIAGANYNYSKQTY